MTSLSKQIEGMAKLPKLYRRYLNERGITDEVIERRKLGFVTYGGKKWIGIPIYGTNGEAVSLILRSPPDAPEGQKRYQMTKGSVATLYPLDVLTGNESVLLCEGVLDALAADSVGIPAVSGTAGAGTFKEDWLALISEEKKITICYDNDEAGRKGRDKVLTLFSEKRPDLSLSVIDLPDMGEGKKDVTDFLIGCDAEDRAKTLADLAQPCGESLVSSTPSPSLRSLLIEELRKSSGKTFLPLQGTLEGVGYYTVTLRREGGAELFLITANRDCFPCTEEALKSRGLSAVRFPAVDVKPRWDQHQLLDFLEGAEALSLADAYHLVFTALRQHLDFKDERYFPCIACWTLGTYFYRIFPAFPYLHFNGVIKSGKTKALQLLAHLAFNGEHITSASSPASVVRLIDTSGITCCLDEAENLWNASSEYSATMQDILRSGYKRGVFVTKCEPEGNKGKFKVLRLDPYSPKALSGIQGLEDALASRCIPIPMMPTKRREIANSQIDVEARGLVDLRGIVYPATLCVFSDVEKLLPTLDVGGLNGREAELWRPILAIAKLADATGDLYRQMLAFALEIQGKRKDEEEDSDSSRVLVCIHELLQGREQAFLTAEEVFLGLAEDDDLSWVSLVQNRTKRGRWLNRNLRTLGLWEGRARNANVNGRKKRGYDISTKKVREVAENQGVTLTPPSSHDPF